MEYIEEESVAADVCEIIEALEAPGVTNATDDLLALTERCKDTLWHPETLDLITAAATVFERRRGKDSHHFLFMKNKTAEDIAEKLRDLFSFWPYFVYHGTSSKALPSIIENGLIAGYGKSRWKGVVDDAHLASGVFLTDNWRSAVSWAKSTALTRNFEFRKDGSKPAVIRIKAEHIELYRDRWANRPGCLITPESFEIPAADTFLVNARIIEQLPMWAPLNKIAPTNKTREAIDEAPRFGL